MRLEVTRKCDLAVQSLRVLDGTKTKMKASELAENIGTSAGITSQVLNPLVRQGWVVSEPGPIGGYSLVASLDDISVLQVVEVIEGPTLDGVCVLSDGPCEIEGECALHSAWSKARNQMLNELDSTSIAQALKG